MTRAYLGLGGNIGTPRRAMTEALGRLDASADVSVVAVSPLYRTAPWGITDQPDFLNAVAAVETGLLPRALLDLCLSIEAGLKRVRRERWGPRLIDIDVLVFGTESVSEPGLQIPHPRMFERAFVMVPLAAVAPGLVVGGRSVAALAASLDGPEIRPETADGLWWREKA